MAIAIFSWNRTHFVLFLPKVPGVSGGNVVSIPSLKQKNRRMENGYP
ncbi:MAG: hypothetical protein WBN75_04860 [Verrucomicrobiia bacterium]|jgi:hypothetical protein